MVASGVLLLAARAPAQDASVVAATENPVVAPALRDAAPPPLSRPSSPPDTFFSFGSVSLHPHVLIRSLYGMGLPTDTGRHVASMINTQAPGLRVDVGTHWSFDYTPTWTAYSAQALKDTLDHSANFQGAGKAQEWAWQWTESYNDSSPILIETGAQTAQRTWVSVLGASRGFGSGLVFSTSASLNERYGEIQPDTRDWATMNWLTVHLATRFELGLGVGAGYSDIVAQPDATNERYMGRFNWRPIDKLSLSIDGGVESRHSRATHAIDMNNPVLTALLDYRPFETTKITVGAARTVANSYFQKQVTIGSSWNCGLEQRLLGRLFLRANYNHQNTDFKSTEPVLVIVLPEDPALDPATGLLVSLPGRADRIATFDSSLTVQLLKRWTVAGTYRRSHNRSTQAGFTFISTQFGLEVACRF